MGRKVVLLHYTGLRVVGGVERVLEAHAAGLRDAGAEVTIVVGRGAGGLPGVASVRIPELDALHPLVRREAAAFARGLVPPGHAALTDRIEQLLRPYVDGAERVVVHNVFTLHKNHALSAALERLALQRPGKFIAWTHDLAWADPRYATDRHPGEPWDRYGRAVPGVKYVAVTDARATETAAILGMPKEDVTVVGNGVSIDEVLGISPASVQIATRLGLYDADPLILVPARITRRKRIEVAIAAAQELRRTGRAAQLVVTGPPGAHDPSNASYLTELRGLAVEAEGVHLLYDLGIGLTPRMVSDFYHLSDVVLITSATEGYGLPLLEAAMNRVPVVCTDLPPLREVAGEDGTYVPPTADGRAFAKVVEERLATDRSYRLRQRARQRAWPAVVANEVVPLVLGAREAS